MFLRCLLLLLLYSGLAFGQSPDTVVIEGVVVDADSAFILESVHLRVLNTNRGGATRTDGRFKTRIARQDTLMFTRVGYQPYQLVVADSTPRTPAAIDYPDATANHDAPRGARQGIRRHH